MFDDVLIAWSNGVIGKNSLYMNAFVFFRFCVVVVFCCHFLFLFCFNTVSFILKSCQFAVVFIKKISASKRASTIISKNG